MSAMDLTPEQEAHRLLGKAINLSSAGKRGDAALKVTEARELLDDEPYEMWRHLQATQIVDVLGPDFRDHVEKARDELEADQ